MSRKQNTESSGTNEKHRSQLNWINMEIIRQVKDKRIFSLNWMPTALGQLCVQLWRESMKLQNECGML